jgi:hypothetical protein
MTDQKKSSGPKRASKKIEKITKKPKDELNLGQLDDVTGGAVGGAHIKPDMSSDVRLKTDIEPLMACLDLIEALEPVSYRFKAGGGTELGFIAQQLREVVPEVVAEGADGYLRVSYAQLAAPLAGAVRELAGELRAMRRDHTAALTRIDKLESELARAKAETGKVIA